MKRDRFSYIRLMNQEIEYKFLVDADKWGALTKPKPKRIVQSYLQREKKNTVRVRIKDDKGFLTIKGLTVGVTRTEFEYEIPVADVTAMIDDFDLPAIRKKRFEIEYKGHTWEVDVFEGRLSGLILAEIELDSEDEAFEIPDWITENVSDNPEYYNSMLIAKC